VGGNARSKKNQVPFQPADKNKMLRLVLLLFLLWSLGCSTFFPAPESVAPVRGLASVSPGGLNDEESKACDEVDGECRYFIAPCSLKEHSPLYRAPGSTAPNEYMSLKDEAYLNQLEDLSKRGFCQMAPRAMPAELYSRDTCIYVFIKKDRCN
jgi:hypothetical protein